MYTPLELENNIYIQSKRNFIDDYANYNHYPIDMTLSGKYLAKYPRFKIKYKSLSEYPINNIEKELIDAIIFKENIKNEVIIGAGANGILQNIVKVLFSNSGNMVTPYLTFNEPEYAVTSLGRYYQKSFYD